MSKRRIPVMPREPFTAIQYTGDNVDEVVEFSMGAFIRDPFAASWGVNELCKSAGGKIDKGTWIVEVFHNNPKEPRYVLMTDEYFQKHYTLCSQRDTDMRPVFGRSDEDNKRYLAELRVKLEQKYEWAKEHPEEAQAESDKFLRRIGVLNDESKQN